MLIEPTKEEILHAIQGGTPAEWSTFLAELRDAIVKARRWEWAKPILAGAEDLITESRMRVLARGLALGEDIEVIIDRSLITAQTREAAKPDRQVNAEQIAKAGGALALTIRSANTP